MQQYNMKSVLEWLRSTYLRDSGGVCSFFLFPASIQSWNIGWLQFFVD
jgi:hypothetical protein